MFARLTLLSLFAAALVACAPAVSGFDDCPVTQLPDDPNVIGPLYGDEDGLQVYITPDGIWKGLPDGENGGYVQKIFWKYPGYKATEDPQPDFKLSGRQLDGNATFVEPGPATNAMSPELYGDGILAGAEIPVAGCWELTGQYKGSQLSFVVWVGEAQ